MQTHINPGPSYNTVKRLVKNIMAHVEWKNKL
jgi:hypothetical protein